jgi:malate dehydrogenase (oxaloacetate-decarboxylating)
VQSRSSYSATTELASAVADSGVQVTALDMVESHHDGIVVDVACNAVGDEHVQPPGWPRRWPETSPLL